MGSLRPAAPACFAAREGHERDRSDAARPHQEYLSHWASRRTGGSTRDRQKAHVFRLNPRQDLSEALSAQMSAVFLWPVRGRSFASIGQTEKIRRTETRRIERKAALRRHMKSPGNSGPSRRTRRISPKARPPLPAFAVS